MNDTQILRSLMESMQKTSQPKTSPYDTTAEVRRIEDGIAWVHIAGGVDETPVKLTINAKEGDNVQVRVSGGTAFLVGNGTAPPTDDTRANIAQNTATSAQIAADTALQDAERAKEAADSAQASADSAAASAASAQVSANNANEYASRALGGLSTVQSVTETLNWITQHGTMTLTTDTALDPTHVYFVQDAQGDYVVGSTHYSIVTEPSADDLSTYYVLSIDESLQNYVGTHLAVTGEGLWVLPAATGYKVLIATGQGQTYTEAGTYIIDSSGGAVAKFGQTVQIGDVLNSHLMEDFHSIQLVDKEGYTYFHVSDLRDATGYADITEYFIGDGTTDNMSIHSSISSDLVVKKNDTVLIRDTDYTISSGVITFATTPASGDVITGSYKTADRLAKAYTFGFRKTNSTLGLLSVAEGRDTIADGYYSHAEGYSTTASGFASHAEGDRTLATNYSSHAEGISTKATGMRSHAEGNQSKATNDSSHAEGDTTTASGLSAHAEGGATHSYGDYAHAEGYHSEASGSMAHAEGGWTTASGSGAHAEGQQTTASGACSHAEGYATEAIGKWSHAEGYESTADGYYSHAQNRETKASSDSQTALGKYNVEDTNNKYAAIIGNGTADDARSDALRVDWDGNVEIALNTSASSGTTDGYLYAAITALGWESEVIV